MIQIFKLPKLNPTSLKNKKTLILGAGYTGLTISNYLQYFGCQIKIADSRDNPPNSKEFFNIGLTIEFVDLDNPSDQFIEQYLSDVDFIAISPGIPLTKKLIKIANIRLIPVVSEIEIFGQAVKELDPNTKLIGISGSNGKTTVASLLGMLFSNSSIDCEVVGNIKPAALEILLNHIKNNSQLPPIWVIELSSFQLATTYRTQFFLGAVLNFSENHLDWHPNLEDYFNSKQKLYTLSLASVINNDDEFCKKMSKYTESKVKATFGIKNLADFTIEQDTQAIKARGQTLGNRKQISLIGDHNSLNVLAALALYHSMGMSLSNAIEILSEFKGLPHRMELIANIDGVDFINDSKSTTVASTKAAISGLLSQDRPIILIAGGIGKNQDFKTLAEVIDNRIKRIILIGEDAKKIESQIHDHSQFNLNNLFEIGSNLDSAISRAVKIAEQGDIILFSPACASFDMFLDYQDRGEKFRNRVLNSQIRDFVQTNKIEI